MSSITATSEAYRAYSLDPSHSHLSPIYLDNLKLSTIPTPTPGPNEVLIRVRAVSLNFKDVLTIAFSPIYPILPKEGIIPCLDAAGEIVSAGSNSKFATRIGEKVILSPSGTWVDGDASNFDLSKTISAGENDGVLAQYVTIGDELVVPMPKNLEFEEAAALPGAAGTAIHVLHSIKVGKGTTVVTQGTGGVSCFMIQLASALGAKVIATSSSDERLQIAKRLGATELINYKSTPDWATEVIRLTGGKGADLIADIGGTGTVEQSLKALRQGGTACLVGFLATPKAIDLFTPIFNGAKTLKGIIGFSKAHLEELVKVVEEHDLHPQISHTYEWSDAKEAFERLSKQALLGRLLSRSKCNITYMRTVFIV